MLPEEEGIKMHKTLFKIKILTTNQAKTVLEITPSNPVSQVTIHPVVKDETIYSTNAYYFYATLDNYYQ
jgi:hypothetical protein